MTGFKIIPEVISEESEKELIEVLQECLKDGKNYKRYNIGHRSRVKRYGYDYTDKEKMLEPIPSWLLPHHWEHGGNLRMMAKQDWMRGGNWNSVQINEYEPGNGITAHTDAEYFGAVIAVLSLGGDAVMTFHHSVFMPCVFLIPPRSLSVLSGEARDSWEHSIDGKSVTKTRYSIVFRERLLK